MKHWALVVLRVLMIVGGTLAVPVQAYAADCSKTTTDMTALPDLAGGTYKGQPGGLYAGTNDPPPAYADAGRRAAAQILPLDVSGKPSPSGKVVLLSIGMSNTTQEFSAFVALAKQDPLRAPSVVVVDGAQGGQDARVWAKADAQTWGVVDQRLQANGVNASQVEAVWLKQAVAQPGGDFPTSSRELTDLLDAIVRIAAQRYPQLRQVFLSPRTYAGYATTSLNPEPYAYESGFADRTLIMRSVAAPEVRPWIGWGPYLWTDGTRGRSDGLVWTCADVRDSDGTHPSTSGQQKVAHLLLDHFDTSPFATWYRGQATGSPTPEPKKSSAPGRSPQPSASATTSEPEPTIAPTSETPAWSLLAGIGSLADDLPLLIVVGAFAALGISTGLIARTRKP